MLPKSARVCSFALLSASAFGQSVAPAPSFEAADVHVSPHANNPSMRGGLVRGGRYEMRTATMVDLIRIAYSVDETNVIGGPSWLDTDRYDVIAKVPANSTPESLKPMLQALLADRFKLAVHSDSKSLSGYALTAGKHPLIRQSDGSGAKGCENRRSDSAVVNQSYSCHGMTMAAFADTLRDIARGYIGGNPVTDATGLKGAWDFDVRWSGRGLLATAGSEGVSLFDAIDKQLGLKLDLQKVSVPVIVVDSVNRTPTENQPGVAKALPVLPAEFEVADVKPSSPGTEQNFRIQPGGRLDAKGMTLKDLIEFAFDLDNDDAIAGGPKWLDSERFDIVAKAPSDGQQIDFDAMQPMAKTLLADRFRLATHYEDRPVTVYALVPAKPKLKAADPANRSGCRNMGAASGGPASALLRTYTCQNMTMALFADKLRGFAPGYVDHPVVDATGIDGPFDFAFSFSGAGVFRNGGGRGAGQAPAASSASDPNGAISLFEALEKQLGLKLEVQKHPMPVLVVDHVEQKPTEN